MKRETRGEISDFKSQISQISDLRMGGIGRERRGGRITIRIKIRIGRLAGCLGLPVRQTRKASVAAMGVHQGPGECYGGVEEGVGPEGHDARVEEGDGDGAGEEGGR